MRHGSGLRKFGRNWSHRRAMSRNLATSFLEHDLVDKLMLFVAPTIAGEGQLLLGELDRPVRLRRLHARPVGDDVLLSAYVHEP